MPVPANLVLQSSVSNGLGDFTLNAVDGKQTFEQAFGTGATLDVFDYFISSRDNSEWEYGTGHMLNVTTLVRDTVIESSNSDNPVNFTAGTTDVTNDVPADNQARLDGDQTFTGVKTFSAQLNLLSGLQFDDPNTQIVQFEEDLEFHAAAGGSYRFDIGPSSQFVITETDIRCNGNIFRLQGGHIEFDSNLTKISQNGLDLFLDVVTGGKIDLKTTNTTRFSVSDTGANGEGLKIVNVADPTEDQDVVTKAFGDANYVSAGKVIALAMITGAQ